MSSEHVFRTSVNTSSDFVVLQWAVALVIFSKFLRELVVLEA